METDDHDQADVNDTQANETEAESERKAEQWTLTQAEFRALSENQAQLVKSQQTTETLLQKLLERQAAATPTQREQAPQSETENKQKTAAPGLAILPPAQAEIQKAQQGQSRKRRLKLKRKA